jgi:ABC-type Fe3+ transport system substrate-binding protein
MGIPKNAPHPNAARLWVNYVLSREAQALIYEREFSDSHLLEGSKMAAEVAKLQERSPKLLIVDVAFYQTHDEAYLNRVLNEIQKLLQKQ